MSDESSLPPISAGVRRMVEAEREPIAIDPAIADEVWKKLEASIIALPPPSGSSGPSGSSAPSTGAAGAAFGAKALALAFVAGGAIGAALHAGLAQPVIERVEVPVTVVQTVTTTIAVPVTKVVTATAIPSKPRPMLLEIQGRERALLERARTALSRGDPSAARAAIDEARAIAPRGRLSEERDALEIQALAALGKHDAILIAIKKFKARYPRSIYLPVVDAASRSQQRP
jgi:hypothetical protein